MEFVSPVSTALSQVIKNMHPQEASASLSQPPHIPQGLVRISSLILLSVVWISPKTTYSKCLKSPSPVHELQTLTRVYMSEFFIEFQTNMHPNTTAAHNYTNQHSFSLNITSSTTGPFTQNQEQAPASNHPVANPGGGQTFIQKSNNVSGASGTSPALLKRGFLQATPPSPAPVEVPLPEKGQSNGTSEDGQPALLTGNSVGKDKPASEVCIFARCCCWSRARCFAFCRACQKL